VLNYGGPVHANDGELELSYVLELPRGADWVDALPTVYGEVSGTLAAFSPADDARTNIRTGRKSGPKKRIFDGWQPDELSGWA